MAMIRQPVCFNMKNESQKELYEMCKSKFGQNMSNGIRSILWAYFNNTGNNQVTIRANEDTNDLVTVL